MKPRPSSARTFEVLGRAAASLQCSATQAAVTLAGHRRRVFTLDEGGSILANDAALRLLGNGCRTMLGAPGGRAAAALAELGGRLEPWAHWHRAAVA
jgi:L-serine deaminase